MRDVQQVLDHYKNKHILKTLKKSADNNFDIFL